MISRAAQADLFCETCNIPFQRREHYQRHLRTHTKEKPFSCTECGQSFGRVDSLARHHTALHANTDRRDNRDGQSEHRRVAQACKPCSTSKVRCDGERPCHRCRRQDNECYYELAKRKVSEAGPEKSLVKRYKNSSDRNNAENDINNNNNNDDSSTDVIHSPLSPPSTIHEGGSHETTQTDTNLSPEDEHLDQSKQNDLANNIMPIAPLVQFPISSVTEYTDNSVNELDILLDGGNMFLDFDTSKATPTSSFIFGDPFETAGWLDYATDKTLMPHFLQNGPSVEAINDLWLDQAGLKNLLPTVPSNPPPVQMMDQSAVAELYSRSHSPAIDKDAVEPREYYPVSIEVDAQLVFPDMSHLTTEDVDHENLAHVDEIPAEVGEKITQFANEIQDSSHYPRFRHLRIPPGPVLNAWVQLYFENFHPILPILHKASFSSSKRHWLLIFSVAAIGSHFSGIKDALVCSRAMHELIRRQTSTLCEQQNSNGRELWMAQAILLNHIGLMYAGERRSLEIAEILQALPVALGRRKRLFVNMFPMHKFSQLQLPLTQKWQIWLLDEERRRAGYATWLLDSAFDSHFDLTRLMKLSELQISLPQMDDRWGASTAQSWASFPAVFDTTSSGGLPTMERLVADSSWKSTWQKTNTLGKQVMLQHLSEMIKYQSSSQPSVPGFSYHDKLLAADILTDFLALTESEHGEQPIDDVKAAVTHQIMALSALMSHNTPTSNLLPTIVRFIYRKMEDEEWTQMGEQWSNLPNQGRLGCFYAARILQAVRSSHNTHFGTPICLLRAVFTLWLYSALSERFQGRFLYPPPAPAVVLGPKPLNDMDSTVWISSGWSRVKLPGIGNLLHAQGRSKLLDDAIVLMRSLKAWGISSTYSHILLRLRASEMSRSGGTLMNQE